MDYNKLLDFVVDVGYELSMCGAEIYRVEESITRILAAYDTESEVYALPNTIIVSITRPDGKPLTRMRRVGFHGNDLDGVELFSDLSRKICTEKPDADTAIQLLQEARKSKKGFSTPWTLVGYFFGAAGFSLFFCGGPIDMIVGGISGFITGICLLFADKFRANNFFKTTLASFVLALVPYGASILGLCPDPDSAVTGAVMVLIPGLLFTYAMRDIIYGDTNAGVNRIVQVFLVAIAIAAGTSGAWSVVSGLWGTPDSVPSIDHSFPIECLAGIIGCIGFSILFNIHKMGIVFGCLGSVFGWGAYCIVTAMGGGVAASMLVASAVVAVFAEIMARIRKCPAIGYLVVSLIPLIPGSALYYTMNYAVRGDMSQFGSQLLNTVIQTSMMAVGILLVSTSVRMWAIWKIERKKKK